MIFFATGDGTIIKTLPSPVYQGSENASEIYLIAPFSPNLKVTVRFRLPNGIWTTPTLMDNGIDGNQMTAQGTLASPDGAIVDKETGKQYAVWTKPISGEVTQYYGTVTAQFFFYAAQGGVVTSTSAANFPVGRGVPAVLPDAPTEDVYEAILSNLSALQEQLDNGTYTARSIYAWNSSYTYGAGEIVFYPDKGEYGVFVKSLVSGNKAVPYVDGKLSENWEEVVDFNFLNDLYDLSETIGASVQAAQAAEKGAEEAERNASDHANSAKNFMNNAEGFMNTALNAAESASGSAASAETSARNIKAVEDYLDGVKSGEISIPKATSDGEGNNIAIQFQNVNSELESLREEQQNESHFRGYVATNVEIQQLSGTPNDYAYSAESGTVWIYQEATGWKNSEKPVPDQTVPPSTTTPLMDGTAAVGSSTSYARGDHRHPSDTSKADLFGANFTGPISASTVTGNNGVYDGNERVFSPNNPPPSGTVPYTETPLMDGVGSAGTSNSYARGDHKHPTDTTRASTAIATQSSNGLMSSADKIKLDGMSTTVVTGVKGNAETSYRTGNANLTPANIGAVPTSRTVNGHALSSNVTVTKSDVGLNNVANERQWSNSNRPTAPKYRPYVDYGLTGETDTVVSYYRSSFGSSWYRKWASGWKECGGEFSFTASNNGTYTINFSAEAVFDTDGITPIVSCGNWYNSDYACQIGIVSISKTSFSFRIAGSTINKVYWYCCGY